MLTSYHNHTRWSDGAATVDDVIASAIRLGLDEVGISDHYVLHPRGERVEWAIHPDDLDRYVNAVLAAAGRTPIPVRLGLEADYFPETAGALGKLLAPHPFDFVIGSVHFVNGFPVDNSADDWAALSAAQRDGVWEIYWERVRGMAESRVFDFAAHLDLPKRFGFRAATVLGPAAEAALDAIAAADMAVEINVAGWFLPAQEAYPAPALLRAARERGIPTLLSADAHRPGDLVRGFDRARELARSAGYTELVRYVGRKQYPAGPA